MASRCWPVRAIPEVCLAVFAGGDEPGSVGSKRHGADGALRGEVDALSAEPLEMSPFPVAQIVGAVGRHAGGQQAFGRVEGVFFDLGRGHADARHVGGVFFALLGATRLGFLRLWPCSRPRWR